MYAGCDTTDGRSLRSSFAGLRKKRLSAKIRALESALQIFHTEKIPRDFKEIVDGICMSYEISWMTGCPQLIILYHSLFENIVTSSTKIKCYFEGKVEEVILGWASLCHHYDQSISMSAVRAWKIAFPNISKKNAALRQITRTFVDKVHLFFDKFGNTQHSLDIENESGEAMLLFQSEGSIIRSLSDFAGLDILSEEELKKVEKILLNVHPDELAQVYVARSLLYFMSNQLNSDKSTFHALVPTTIQVLKHKNRRMKELIPEAHDFIIAVLRHSSSYSQELLHNSIQEIFSAVNFSRGNKCSFNDILREFFSQGFLDYEGARTVITAFLKYCDPCSFDCHKAILTSIMWIKEASEHCSNVLYRDTITIMLEEKSKWQKPQIQFIIDVTRFFQDSPEVSEWVADKLCSMADETILMLDEKICSHNQPIVKDTSIYYHRMLDIATVAFSVLLNIKEETLIKLYDKFVTVSIEKECDSGPALPLVQNFIALMGGSDILKKSEYYRDKSVNYLLSIREKANPSEYHLSIYNCLYRVVAFSDAAFATLLKRLKEPSIHELTVGAAIRPESLLLRNKIRERIKSIDIDALHRWSSMSGFTALSKNLSDLDFDSLLSNVLSLKVGDEELQAVTPHLSQRHRLIILKSLSYSISPLSTKSLQKLFKRGVLDIKIIESLFHRIVCIHQDECDNDDARMVNLKMQAAKSEKLEALWHQVRALLYIISANIRQINLVYTIRFLPLCCEGVFSELLPAISNLFTNLPEQAAKTAFSIAFRSRKSSWDLFVCDAALKKFGKSDLCIILKECIMDNIERFAQRYIYYPLSSSYPTYTDHIHNIVRSVKRGNFASLSVLPYVFGGLSESHLKDIKGESMQTLGSVLTSQDCEIIAENSCLVMILSKVLYASKIKGLNVNSLRDFSICVLLALSKRFGFHTSGSCRLVFSEELRSEVSLCGALLSLLHGVSLCDPEVSVSRETWARIGSLFIGICVKIVCASTQENDSFAYATILEEVCDLSSNPFLVESIHCFYSIHERKVPKTLKLGISLLQSMQDHANFHIEKSQFLLLTVLKSFHRTTLKAVGKHKYVDFFITSLAESRTPSEASNESHWACFFAMSFFVLHFISEHLIDTKITIDESISKKAIETVILACSSYFMHCQELGQFEKDEALETFLSRVNNPVDALLLLNDISEKFPSIFHDWYTCAPASTKTPLQRIMRKAVSNNITKHILRSLKPYKSAFGQGTTLCTSDSCCDVTITEDKESLKLRLTLPEDYPISSVVPSVENLDSKRRILGKRKEEIRVDLLRIRKQCNAFLHLKEIIQYWCQNARKHLHNKSACPICCSVLHSENKSLPSMKCGVCKNCVYHQRCLFDWFKKSGNSTCPTCRTEWNSWEL